MARPRRITNEQILATMRACVTHGGPTVSLDTVAGQLGVTAPALLKRFGSRETLMLQALRPPEEPAWVKQLAAGPDERPLEAQLAHILRGIAEGLAEALPSIWALRESGIPRDKLDPCMASATKWGTGALSKWLQQAKQEGLVRGEELENIAMAMIGAVQIRVVMSHLRQRRWSPRAHRGYLDTLAGMFSRALTPTAVQRRTRSKMEASR